MYPMPIKIKTNSPIVTAGGGATLKKNFAWSAGAVRKSRAASITAKTPASLGLRKSETNPAIGIRNPTITKYTADAHDLNSLSRVSNPKGLNRKSTMSPTTNKTAKMRCSLFNENKKKSLYIL